MFFFGLQVLPPFKQVDLYLQTKRGFCKGVEMRITWLVLAVSFLLLGQATPFDQFCNEAQSACDELKRSCEGRFSDEPNTIPRQAGLIQPEDLVYLGAFILPKVSGQPSRFPYGGYGSAYRKVDGKDRLFLTGHDHHQMVAEIEVPVLKITKDPNQLNQAKLVQGFTDIMSPVSVQIDKNRVKHFDFIVYDDLLYFTLYQYYNGAGIDHPVFGWTSLILSSTNTKGLTKLVSSSLNPTKEWHSYKYSGYLMEIPKKTLDVEV